MAEFNEDSFREEVKDCFSANGIFSATSGYEFRNPQLQMAEAVSETLSEGGHLVIEAPTGVGKSFAYLLPSVLYSLGTNRKAIISTATINLQEQLVKKDLPFIQNVLPQSFVFEILKGRNNYICSKRLSRALANHEELFESAERDLLQEIYDRVQRTGIGERQHLPVAQNTELWFSVWSEINAEQGICSGRSCGGEETNCYYQQAKLRIKNANVIVVNHHLFFTLFSLYDDTGNGFIFSNDYVVFDEAHLIESIAAENVSPRISREMLRFRLLRLYNPRTHKGFLANKDNTTLVRLVLQCLQDTDYFFSDVENHVLNKYRLSAEKPYFRIKERIEIEKDLLSSLDELAGGLKSAASRAMTEGDKLDFENHWAHVSAFRNTINDFLELSDPAFVYWIEFAGKPRGNTKLNTAPLDMSGFFRDKVFTSGKTSVCTSATLSINNSLDHFKRSIGAESARGMILPSSFDFHRQMKIFIESTLPAPEAKEENRTDYENALNEAIMRYVEKTKGGALVLFTNSALLKRSAAYLKSLLEAKGIKVFSQGSGVPRNKLLEDFRLNENSILLGVDSFWMGVDVPGSSLRNVIITRLPFGVPDHPIMEAKCEMLKAQGRDPFREVSLPSAIIKLKQGAGRLIRNKNDEGILAILDSRITSKFYGRLFLNSLPECEIIVENGSGGYDSF